MVLSRCFSSTGLTYRLIGISSPWALFKLMSIGCIPFLRISSAGFYREFSRNPLPWLGKKNHRVGCLTLIPWFIPLMWWKTHPKTTFPVYIYNVIVYIIYIYISYHIIYIYIYISYHIISYIYIYHIYIYIIYTIYHIYIYISYIIYIYIYISCIYICVCVSYVSIYIYIYIIYIYTYICVIYIYDISYIYVCMYDYIFIHTTFWPPLILTICCGSKPKLVKPKIISKPMFIQI